MTGNRTAARPNCYAGGRLKTTAGDTNETERDSANETERDSAVVQIANQVLPEPLQASEGGDSIPLGQKTGFGDLGSWDQGGRRTEKDTGSSAPTNREEWAKSCTPAPGKGGRLLCSEELLENKRGS